MTSGPGSSEASPKGQCSRRRMASLVIVGCCLLALLLAVLRSPGPAEDDDPTLAFLHGYAGVPAKDFTFHIKRIGSFGFQGFDTADGNALTCLIIGTSYHDIHLPFAQCLALVFAVPLLSGFLGWLTLWLVRTRWLSKQ